MMRLINADHLPKEKKMQIKIDIPEKVYYDALHYVECLEKSDFELWMIRAIKNGVLLPKGHGRLIDVSEYFEKEFGDAREFLDKATTIIEADTESEAKE